MVVTCDDLIFNDFHMSDYDLVSGNGSDGEIDDTEDMSLAPSSETVFTGERIYSTFVSQKYENANEFTVKFIKAICGSNTEDTFGENELRNYNRLLTGKTGFSWLKIVNTDVSETDYYYRARVSKIEYERLGKKVVGYDVTFECDSGQAYSEEQTVYINAKANTPFYVYNNSDDLHDYLKPTMVITVASAGTLTLTNQEDSWATTVKNMAANEKLTLDSKNEIITSSKARTYILNDFENLHWPRLLPGKNTYKTNRNCTIQITFRAIRKVGFVS